MASPGGGSPARKRRERAECFISEVQEEVPCSFSEGRHGALDFSFIGPDIEGVKKRRKKAAELTASASRTRAPLPSLDIASAERGRWKRLRTVHEGRFTSLITTLRLIRGRKGAVTCAIGGSTHVNFSTFDGRPRRPSKNETQEVDTHRRPPTSTTVYSKFKNIVRCVAPRLTQVDAAQERLAKGTTTLGTAESGCDLVGASDESGFVQIFDLKTRTQLRRLRGHSGPVGACCFSSQCPNLFLSGGEDTSLRLWDISDGSCVVEVASAHSDSVRCLASSPASPAVAGGKEAETDSSVCHFASGGADQYLKVWRFDIATGAKLATTSSVPHTQSAVKYQCTERMHHGSPVEALTFFPSGSLLVSGGGLDVKVWDLSGGAHLVHTLRAHLKTVSCVEVACDGSYIASASLDQSIKFFDSSKATLVHTINFEESVTALSLTGKPFSDSEYVAIGLADGRWQLRCRRKEPERRASFQTSSVSVKANTRDFFCRGLDSLPRPGDLIVKDFRRPRLTILDNLLRKFRFQASLDKALRLSPEIAIALIERLIDEGSLGVAVKGRNEVTIVPLLHFAAKQIGKDVNETFIFLDFLNSLLEHNGWLRRTTDPAVIQALRSLEQVLDEQVTQHQILDELTGVIDLIWSSTRSL